MNYYQQQVGTVHTAQNISTFSPLILHAIIAAQMLSSENTVIIFTLGRTYRLKWHKKNSF